MGHVFVLRSDRERRAAVFLSSSVICAIRSKRIDSFRSILSKKKQIRDNPNT